MLIPPPPWVQGALHIPWIIYPGPGLNMSLVTYSLLQKIHSLGGGLIFTLLGQYVGCLSVCQYVGCLSVCLSPNSIWSSQDMWPGRWIVQWGLKAAREETVAVNSDLWEEYSPWTNPESHSANSDLCYFRRVSLSPCGSPSIIYTS